MQQEANILININHGVVNKKDDRKAIVVAVLVHILLILFFIFYKIETVIPPFPDEEVVMEMDFTGSESSGGAPQQVSESVKESSANTEDVATQDEESPVEVNQNETNTSETNSTNNTETNETESQDPKYTFNNVFGEGDDGSGTGTEDGDGENGQGDGIDGPGTTGSYGKMGNRKMIYEPDPRNPIDPEGDVRVRITVDKGGNVIEAKVLASDAKTTSTHQAHFNDAIKIAKEFKFEPSSTGKDKEYTYIIIKFRNK